jgi:hypothetical protein
VGVNEGLQVRWIEQNPPPDFYVRDFPSMHLPPQSIDGQPQKLRGKFDVLQAHDSLPSTFQLFLLDFNFPK